MEAAVPPATTASSKVSQETIERAITALLKWKTSKSANQKPQLLASDEFIYLVLTLHKIPPKARTNAHKIPLPNPIFSAGESEFCLFLDDRHLSSKSAKQKVLDEKIPVAKIIKLSKLKTDYKPYEAKRKLCDSYDMFFADKRIIPLLPRLIGKQFYKKKKIPIPIELGRKNWKEQIDRVCGSALLFINTGTCSVVRVARGSMEREEIVENVMGAINGVIEFIPKKWKNVRSLHLKFSESVALPLYQAVPEIKMKFGGAMAVRDDNVGGDELVEREKGEESEKKSSKVAKKKGRIHEVRYMDNVGFGEMIGDDDSESVDDDDDDDDDEMGSAEIVGKKRKNGSGEKKGVKKVPKVKKGEKGLKNKKGKVLEKLDSKMGSAEIAVGKREKGLKNKKEKVLDTEMGSPEIAVGKREKGVKNTMKVKKGEMGLKQKKEKVSGKSMAEKKSKKSKVAV